MAAHGQQSFPGASDAIAGTIPVPPANVMEAAVTPAPAPESHYSLQTMIGGTPTASGQWPGESLIRDEVMIHERSPRFLHQNMIQNSQRPPFNYGVSCMGGSNCDRVSHSQYEDLVGMLGDQVAGVSGIATSAPSEKILSSSSLPGDQIGPRVKFMCSFGGKILPRPADGKLRYAGGDTRIISIYRHSKYTDLICKMRHLYGQPVLMKYQLPNEELDALISVSCDEDVENMMEEYDRLQASDNSSKLRIFLFSPSEYDVVHLNDSIEATNSEKVYVDAINGIPDPVNQIGMVSTCCSGNLARIESSDVWALPRIPMNMSVALSSVPVSHATVQSIPTAMFQPNTQILPRIYAASPSKPSSPAMASYMSHSAIPDISHHLYPEKITKGPVVHLHERQCFDAASICTQHESAIWPTESRRLTDSPTKAQNDNLVDHGFRLEQINKVDSSLPRVITQIDSYGRSPRVTSQINLMHLTSDCLHGDMLCTQSCVVQEQPHVHHTHHQYPSENTAVPMAPHQHYTKQYCSHQHEETGGLNQMDRPLDTMAGHKPVRIKNTVHHTCAGAVVTTESSPPSPRIAYNDRLNLNGVQQYLPSQGSGLSRGPIEQNVSKTVLHNQNQTALRGLKPLNTRLDTRDQFLHIDDQSNNKQQFSLPPVKVDLESRGTPKEHEGGSSRNYFMGVVTQPPVPLYVGGSPYRETSSPFVDIKATRGDVHENIQRDVEVYSQQQEGIDYASTSIHKDQRTTERDTLNQIDVRDDLVSECSRKNVETPHANNFDSSYINPLSNDRQFNKHDPKSIDNPLTVAETFAGEFLCSSTHPAPIKEPPFHNPLSAAVHMVDDQGQPEVRIPSAAFSNVGPSNSLFVGNVEEGRLINGFDVGTQQNKEAEKPLMDDGFQITPNPLVSNIRGDGLSGHNTDDKKYSDSEVSGIHAVDNLDVMANKTTYPVDVGGAVAPDLSCHVPVLNSDDTVPCSNYLTEGMKNADLLTSLQRDDLGGIGIPSDNIHLKVEGSSVTKSTQTPNLIENNGLPVFDSDSIHGTRNEDIKLDVDPCINTTGVSPTSLFTASTLSMRNWQDDLSTSAPTGNDLPIGNGRVADADLLAVEKKVMETNIVDKSENGEETKPNKPMNVAAIAEAEAINRGLQTIKNEDLEELKELGTGTFGTVYHGKWRGTDVAIKRIKPTCFTGRPSERERLVADFWKEAYILGQLHHPNVVAFYGVVPDGPGETLATVTEYMVNGSLKQVLQKKDRTIDRRKRLMIIMDAAFGMEYLHGKNIVHFDLKCENLLVNMKDPQRPICKVGDLGLSKVKHQTMVSGGVRGTLPWMAPELLSGSSNLVSEKVDVFSFGIVMWELLTGEEPYANMHYGAIIGGIVNNTLRPPVPSWCDPAWKSLMERCWSADPVDRPSFLEIAAELRAMASAKPQV